MYQKTLAELSQMLASGDCSSQELTEHYLERIKRFNGELNALISVSEQSAMDAAKKADASRDDGNDSALLGIPMIHKDIFCVEGGRTTCGSKMLENFESPYNATVVNKLNDAGMVLLGKANMDEFAMGSSNENSYFGPVKNPWKHSCVPGGSSGGSASSMAARLAPLATGTDTGGSIRQPAAFCGLTGLKPTYGRVSRYGMIAFASSLDQAGPMAATAEDCAMVLQAMAGFDERDSTSSSEPVANYTENLNSPIDGLKIGVPEEYFSEGLDEAVAKQVRDALAEYEKLGATLVPMSLPNQNLCIPAYYVVAPAEASSNLSRFDGVRFGYRCDAPVDLEDLYTRSRGEGFGAEVKRRIMIGTYALSAGYYDAYYLKAQQVRRLISNDFDAAFQDVDVIAGPTTPSPAFETGAKSNDPIAMYLNDLYTVSANLCGLPALSMPCGQVDGLPVGLQLTGQHFDEARLLHVAHRYQQVTDWHKQLPSGIE